MSIMDKIKSFFSGGSSADAHDHAGHDHSGHDHSDHDHSDHDPSDHDYSHDTGVPPIPMADPTGMPMPDPDPGSEADQNRPA